ncbi:hypothetical protein PR048_009994 [Dryococelus australis]|uniref:Uncharacterized protein n=1 Tax=Dryococelus australis TaxID=614101 RepID=A0ABQ9I2I9_9NEOP|nr:hypothetical protein PR048_009994 [Dryococelus australis]
MNDFRNESPVLDSLRENSYLISLASNFGEEVEKLSENGPTVKLWIQYFKMVNLMKEFINAQQSGDWSAHIDCVKRMIPYFHASGHFPYAKPSQLYVQDMMELSSKMTADEYHKFTKCVYFTIRGSDHYWSGVVISKWIVEISATHDICGSLKEFCGILFSSEQHVDFSMTHITRNTANIGKLAAWFDNHPTFLIMIGIMSIATGVLGYCTIINCYEAVTVGKQAMGKIEGIPFSGITLSQKDRALPLSSVTSSIKIQNDTVVIDPFLLFQRIAISKKNGL